MNTDSTVMREAVREPFRDPGLPPARRAADLIARLTLSEKIAQLPQNMPAVPRLGVAAFRTGTEISHGVAWCGEATVFPQPVGLAATWDAGLLREVGEAIADEVRVMHQRDPGIGLNVWGPSLNLLRDPRWGRNEETFSEDPLLTAELAIALCTGLRGGPDPRPSGTPLKTAPTLKGFLGNNHEDARDTISSTLRSRVFWEYEFVPFERVVRAGVASAVMPAYNSVNGRPCHVSGHLAVLRRHQPDLVTVSDAWGPIGLVEYAKYYADRPHAYSAAIKAGIDSFTCEPDPTRTEDAVHAALSLGLLSEADLDRALIRVFALRAAVGEFDPPSAGQEAPTCDVDPADLPGHRELARRAAGEAIVLLTNRQTTLPLSVGEAGRILVAGLHAAYVFADWYSGTAPYTVTALQGLRERYGDAVEFVEGLDRISLRPTSSSGADGVLAVGGADDPVLRIESLPDDDPRGLFDLIDWGEGALSLRSAATGGFVTVTEDGSLTADRPAPEGWRSNEVFHLESVDASIGAPLLLRGVEARRYATVDGQGRLRVGAEDPASALPLVLATVVDGADTVREAAARADAAVVFVGSNPFVNGREGVDRADLDLPPGQRRLIHAAGVNDRAIVVLVSGFPLTEVETANHAAALLWSAHGGQEFGHAIADVISGRRDASGRLQQTWYRSVDDLGDLCEYDLIKAGKTYQYFTGPVLFPFGHGLSYASYRYGELRVAADSLSPDQTVRARVEIENISDYDGVEVVQLYAAFPDASLPRPARMLLGFQRLEVPARGRRSATFRIPVTELGHWDVGSGRRVVEPGRYDLIVGRSSAEPRSTARIVIAGPRPVLRELCAALVKAADFDDYEGIVLVDETKVAGDAVQSTDGQMGTLIYRNCDLTRPIGRFAAAVARTAPGPAEVSVYAGRPGAGARLARVALPETELGRWSTVESPASSPEAAVPCSEVHVVLHGPVRLSAFGFVEPRSSAEAGRLG